MENKKQKERSVEEYISRIVKPIFEKVAKETLKNRISVGEKGVTTIKFCTINIHNYRLYFDFSKRNFKPLTEPKTSVLPSFLVEHRIKNSTEHEYNNFYGFRITVKRNQIEMINKIDADKWYRIDLSNTDRIKPQIAQITIDKDKQAISTLNKFISIYGGYSSFKILNRHSETKVLGEDKISLIPIKQHWHTDVVKKVYNEPNAEFSDPAFASNYLRTRALEDNMDRIDRMQGLLETMTDKLVFIAENYESHVGMVKEGFKLFKKINRRLDQKKLNNWL